MEYIMLFTVPNQAVGHQFKLNDELLSDMYLLYRRAF